MGHPIIIDSKGKLWKQDKQSVIARLLASQSGRVQLGRSMAAPILNRFDYQGISRKTFLVEQLPSGALPIYDKDPDVVSVAAQRVTVPEFEIFSNPTIKISDVKQRRFSILDGGKKTLNRSGYKKITSW